MNSLPEFGLRVGFVAVAIVLWFWTQRLLDWTAPLPG